MSHVEGFPDRDGLDKIVKLGKAICALVATFGGLLITKYPDNPRITALLTAIAAVCALLPEIQSEFLMESGLNEEPLETPSEINGINPALPPAEAPDFT